MTGYLLRHIRPGEARCITQLLTVTSDPCPHSNLLNSLFDVVSSSQTALVRQKNESLAAQYESEHRRTLHRAVFSELAKTPPVTMCV